MKRLLLAYGTPLTMGLFLVSTVSGIALFLGWQPAMFHEMHEILSLVLVLPFVLHVWRNWRPLLAYFSRPAMPVALAVSLAAAGAFAYGAAGGSSGGNPAFALVRAAQAAPLSTLAPVLAVDEDALLSRLAAAGFTGVTAADTISAIAERSGRDAMEVMAGLTRPAG